MLASGFTSLSLTFFGAAFAGLSTAVGTLVAATLDSRTHATFVAVAVAAAVLTVFFGFVAGRDWLGARRVVARLKLDAS